MKCFAIENPTKPWRSHSHSKVLCHFRRLWIDVPKERVSYAAHTHTAAPSVLSYCSTTNCYACLCVQNMIYYSQSHSCHTGYSCQTPRSASSHPAYRQSRMRHVCSRFGSSSVALHAIHVTNITSQPAPRHTSLPLLVAVERAGHDIVSCVTWCVQVDFPPCAFSHPNHNSSPINVAS
jgi:hypothetical protein